MATEKVLLVTIVNRGWGDRVLEASMKAGAEGGTIVFGRGLGIHEHQKILGICIEPEKEIMLSLIDRDRSEGIINEIIKVARLDKPGTGLAFTVPVDRVMGIVHSLEEKSEG